MSCPLCAVGAALVVRAVLGLSGADDWPPERPVWAVAAAAADSRPGDSSDAAGPSAGRDGEGEGDPEQPSRGTESAEGPSGQQGGPVEACDDETFRRLYDTYRRRFHEKVLSRAEKMPNDEIDARAAYVWNDVFADHGCLLCRRADRVLEAIDSAPDLDWESYVRINGCEAPRPPTTSAGTVLKQHVWSPTAAARFYLDRWLKDRMTRKAYRKRAILLANAPLAWVAVGRDPDRPVLIQVQGPMVFLVALKRTDDYYEAEKLEWLRSKSLDPVAPRPPAPAPQPPSDATSI